eukprot:gnl/TRDRNA2_/TRDRNA2_157526_c0_seq1.p1 gnl/TRDRNA2_/TRDRNA2_157526_c0~~gnl/TRDRNA2_/TRDRNA2_157526_c0_seq1.p1  ORF type:complete len:123 (+),score=20.54 gnl/TRDRNA2_/TRDRNA2_157526_c0_seq1:184-552(+)
MPACPAYHISFVPERPSSSHPEEAAGEVRCRQLIDAAASAGLDGVDLAALPAVVTADVIAYARSKGLGVGVWVSTGLAERLGLALDVEENWAAFSARGAVFFTSDLPIAVWAWRQQQQSSAL